MFPIITHNIIIIAIYGICYSSIFFKHIFGMDYDYSIGANVKG
jgi:hypothetical protein